MRDPTAAGSMSALPNPVHGKTRSSLDFARQARPHDPREIFRQGKTCPVLISCGQDPLLFS